VLGIVGFIAWLARAVTFESIDWANTLGMFAVQLVVTFALGLVTEEGVFRGWLWVALQRAGVTLRWVIVWTSVAFALWHLSTALLPTPYHPALAQVPIYILNAGVIGLNWALLRARSGSIVVTSVSHALWNGLVYTLFGYGTTLGALGIHNTAMFGPEIGFVGLALNMVAAGALWLFVRPAGERALAGLSTSASRQGISHW
jgi:membrane protease YdiL (CAAX protease family)